MLAKIDIPTGQGLKPMLKHTRAHWGQSKDKEILIDLIDLKNSDELNAQNDVAR